MPAIAAAILLSGPMSHAAEQDDDLIVATQELFLPAHLGPSDSLEVLLNADGTIRNLFGEFDVGLSHDDIGNPSKVTDSLLQFIREHAGEYDVSPEDILLLKVREVSPSSEDFSVVKIDQFMDDLPIYDRDIAAVFDRQGHLIVLTAVPTPSRGLDQVGRVTVSSAEEIISGASETPVDFSGFHDATGEGRVFVGENDQETLQLVYSAALQMPIWRAVIRAGTFVIDAKTGEIISIGGSTLDVTGACNVLRRDFVRTSGRTSQLLETGSANLSEEITCEASTSGSNCIWELRREPSGFSHTIQRVQDADGGEEQVTQACSLATPPQFTSTSADSKREQGAFYVANQMRFFVDQNLWTPVSPTQSGTVQITVDDTAVATADFSPLTQDIRCTNNSPTLGNVCTQDVLAHEYGHYVDWTYGGMGNDGCNPGVDESSAAAETIANMAAELFWLDDDETLANYSAMGGMALNNGPSAHTSSGTIINTSAGCAFDNDPSAGRHLQQAWWELMFNRNCSTETCTATTLAGNTIFPGASAEDSIFNMGRCLGFALAISASSYTHNDLRAAMRSCLYAYNGSTSAEAAQRVFSHHGLTCPTCCTGC